MAEGTPAPRKRQPSAGFRWIAWARSRGLKGSQQAVLMTIASHLDRDGEAFLTYDTIARESGVHRGTAIRAVGALLEHGYVVAAAQSNGRIANTYTMTGDGAMQPTLFGGAPEAVPEPKRRRRRRVKPAVKNALNNSEHKRPVHRLLAAFYAAGKVNEQVGAMIDIGRALGVELDAGRLGAALKSGSKAEVAERLGLALFKNVEIPEDFALKNLNGRRGYEKTRRAGRRAAGTASDDASRISSGDF